MFLVRVILLSHIVFTVTSAACCGERRNQCQNDCTGIVCSSDSHCGGQCCIGDSYRGRCAACHKTRNCELILLPVFCHEKCCGSNTSALKCLKTCDGISCTNSDDCDGECCVGDPGNKTCAPCPIVTHPPQCTRHFDCPTNCCKFGTCFPRNICLFLTRPSTPPQPTTGGQCTLNFECITNCCKFGSCERKEVCLSADRPTNPPIVEENQCTWNIDCPTNCCKFGSCERKEACFRPTPTAKEKHCTWNINCATDCCQFEKCVPWENCHSTGTDSSPSKASASVDSKTIVAIAVPIAGIVFLVILSVVMYFLLIRGHKGTGRGASQTTSHPAPPAVDNDARQVTYDKVGDAGNASGVAL